MILQEEHALMSAILIQELNDCFVFAVPPCLIKDLRKTNRRNLRICQGRWTHHFDGKQTRGSVVLETQTPLMVNYHFPAIHRHRLRVRGRLTDWPLAGIFDFFLLLSNFGCRQPCIRFAIIRWIRRILPVSLALLFFSDM